jgi:Tfp pilus assembly protein PilF
MANPGAADLVKAAMQAHGSGDMPHAEQLYRRALEADPGHADAWHLLALALEQAFPAAFDSMYFIWCKRPRG